MGNRARASIAAAAALVFIAIVGLAVWSGDDDEVADLPRVRLSVPGVDEEIDMFGEESDLARDNDATGHVVTEVTTIDQLQMAFDEDRGHPRLILLVDPT